MTRTITWTILGAVALVSPLGAVTAIAAKNASDKTEVSRRFSYDALSEDMKARAERSYAPDRNRIPSELTELSYDQYRAIEFSRDSAVELGESNFKLLPFHLGGLYRKPVSVFEVQPDKRVEALSFSADDFHYHKPLDADAMKALEFPGVAGMRVNFPINTEGKSDEVVSFLGHSYFRALGKNNVYGLSARGLAVNTASPQGEEFPEFTDFYIETPEEDGTVVVNAAMDSPSLTGAFRFEISPGDDTTIDVTARIYARKDIDNIGIAPMTSMFLFNEVNRSAFRDYRERVHDSEGLFILREDGRRIWRSLNNPTTLANSWFSETNPKAFGLLQRNRAFADYQDAEARYERRPSLLIEPIGDWGEGQIRLLEIPTRQETNDNIVAFWTPREKLKAGHSMEYRYIMHWGQLEVNGEGPIMADYAPPLIATIDTNASDDAEAPPPPSFSPELARIVDVRAGLGGVAGSEDQSARKFVVDFKGGALSSIEDPDSVEPRVGLSRGRLVHTTLFHIPDQDIWRLVMDVKIPTGTPVEFNAVIVSQEDERLSENWLYQWRSGDELPA